MIRKILTTLLLTFACLTLLAPAAEASLTGNHKKRDRGQYVMYTAKASCGKAYLWSSPRTPHPALTEQTKRISEGRAKFYKKVRSNAAYRKHTVYARCNNAHGKGIGSYPLEVSLAVTGLPVLPQLLLGLGLLMTGSVLLVVSRKRGLPDAAHAGPG
jgi:hypothetical protein